MLARAQLDRILNDERLTRSLGDEEASTLIEWLADAAERAPPSPGEEAEARVLALCHRGRVLARLVRLWCYDGQPGAAAQLAAVEGLTQALPSGPTDAYRLMRKLIVHEAARRAA